MVGAIPWHEKEIERFGARMSRLFNVFFYRRPFRWPIGLVPILLVFCMVGVAAALPFQEEVAGTQWITNSGYLAAPNGGFQPGLPDWYNSNNVSSFAVTLKGDDDNSPAYIDTFLDFDDIHTSGDYEWVAKYNVDKYAPFSLTREVKNNDFLHLQTGVDIAAVPIPEPATLLLLGSGLICLAGVGKRLKKIS
jgi:hypothetical protein